MTTSFFAEYPRGRHPRLRSVLGRVIGGILIGVCWLMILLPAFIVLLLWFGGHR